MEKIVWDDSFSVGVEEMDEQHKQIIKMVNRMIELKEDKVDSEIVSDTLTKMTEYAGKHFEKEEKYMLEYNYPYYSEQKEQHKEFKKRTATFCMDAMAYKTNVPIEILTYLKDWWINHILKIDMKYKSFFNEKGLDLY
jgi:hemerythrin